MKRILLLRHAKAEPHVVPGGPIEDRERALAARGRREAKTIGRFLALAAQVPDLALTSPARRCEETLDLARRAGKWRCERDVDPALYGGSPAAYLATIRRADDRHAMLALCGHEPTLSELASQLLGGGDLRVPPGTVAAIDFAVERFRDVALGHGQLIFLVPPRLFTDGEFSFAR